MDVYNNYKAYQKYLPDYPQWRDEQDLNRAKKLEYLKRNPDKINSDDIERGKTLLHAIDVMDEYSQANAEDMEVATEFATGQIVGLATTLGMVAGLPFANSKAIKKLASKFSKNSMGVEMIVSMVPSIIGMLIGAAASFPAIVWSTKAQVSASRKGRFEAMRKDLNNPAIFALLTPEQRKKAEEDAKSIELDDRDKKRIEQKKGLGANPFSAIKTLKKYFSEDGQYSKQKAEFDAKLKESEKQFDKPLTPEQIKNAKRDQQILSDIVRRMDVASQDYAENAELATNTLTTLALGTGGLVGWVSNKLLKLMKVKSGNKFAKVIPWAVGAAIPLVMGIYAAQVQKQASRIGRFKVRQEMLDNPASLVYVDKKDSDTMTDVNLPQRAKKPNIFKFFTQLVKDNKEYQKYRKTKSVEDMKFHKAVEKLELTDKQIKDAKVLQMNMFKTFNKVDEKSQVYSESVEAMGSIAQQGVATFGSLAAMGVSTAMMMNMLKNPAAVRNSGMLKTMAKVMTPFAFMILPVILIDIYTTKAQKKASRVADMLALKELENYKHYADYSNDGEVQKSEPSVKSSDNSNLLSKFKA